MKLIITFVAVLTALSFAACTGGSCKVSKSEALKKCVAASSQGGMISAADAKAYCECTIKGMYDKFTCKEMEAFEKEQTQEKQAAMMSIVKKCMGEISVHK